MSCWLLVGRVIAASVLSNLTGQHDRVGYTGWSFTVTGLCAPFVIQCGWRLSLDSATVFLVLSVAFVMNLLRVSPMLTWRSLPKSI
ncbi:hypothetical protein BJ546DRAFT_995154 [Cryomyces antarcticus]